MVANGDISAYISAYTSAYISAYTSANTSANISTYISANVGTHTNYRHTATTYRVFQQLHILRCFHINFHKAEFLAVADVVRIS